jgi:hypothetical protein
VGTPIAAFPTRVATAADLKVANNGIQTTLTTPIGTADTTIRVGSGAGFAPNQLASIDSEIVTITGIIGTTITVGQRGFDGTAAAAHVIGAPVRLLVDAWHHNAVSTEVMAIENFLGPGGQNLGAIKSSANYNFAAQTPGGSLIAGNNTVTLTPVPQGVNGTDIRHYLYISGGTGTAEAVLISGGTAIAGAASGTVIVNCANAHSGAWTIQTATAGIQEAINTVAASPGGYGSVLVSSGVNNIYGTIWIPSRIEVQGSGRFSTLILNQSTSLGAFRFDPFTYAPNMNAATCGLSKLSILGQAEGRTTVDVSAPAIYIYGARQGSYIKQVTIRNHDSGIYNDGGLYVICDDFLVQFYGSAGVYHKAGDGCYYSNGSTGNGGNTSPPVAGSAGMVFINYGGLYVFNMDITAGNIGLLFQPPTGYHNYYGFFINVLADTHASHGWYFDSSQGGAIWSNQFVDCWASMNGSSPASASRGVMMNSVNPTDINGWSWIGGRIRQNGGDGILISGTNIRIEGTEIGGNSTYSLNGYSGISMSNATHVVITGVTSNNSAGVSGSANQAYGLLLGGGTNNYICVTGNDFNGNNVSNLGILSNYAPTAEVVISDNVSQDTVFQTIASAASISVGTNAIPNCKITGTTAIQTITGGWSGRVLKLIFVTASPGGLTTGGNIARAQTVVQNQSVILQFDGTNWY